MAMFGYAKKSKLTGEESARLRSDLGAGLAKIVGDRWVTTDPVLLDTYSWQYAADAFAGANWMPRALAVVMPSCTAEVAAIVRLCGEMGVQFKAVSTGFGAWGAPGEPDTMVQIDLRRMNRILELDERNMYAVVEPYVTGTHLQTEAFKVGLSTHIAGAGGNTSVLASATSVMGQGSDGVSAGFSCRNLLGFEWVTPEGEVVRAGSLEPTGEWFSGDGPGPSLRGVVRGFAGAFGGMGVFTKAAVKMYPWSGPASIDVQGDSPNYFARIPEHHVVAMLIMDGWESLTELTYRLSETEMAHSITRSGASLLVAGMADDNNEFAELWRLPLLRRLRFAPVLVMTAESAEERDLKVDVLCRIMDDLGGGMISNIGGRTGARFSARAGRILARGAGPGGTLRSGPALLKFAAKNARRYGPRKASLAMLGSAYLAVVRQGQNVRMIFRFGGSFQTSLGGLETIDNAVLGAKLGAQVKRRYIATGAMFDDDGDNCWGSPYDSGAMGHLEELVAYDPVDPECSRGVMDYITETNLLCIDAPLTLGINALGPVMGDLFNESCSNYNELQKRIKVAFDPGNTSEGSFYVQPDFQGDERVGESLARVRADRVEVDPSRD